MKIPPLKEMEPLPPVPSCSRDLAPDEIGSVAEHVEEGDFIDDSNSDSDLEDECRPRDNVGVGWADGIRTRSRRDQSSMREPGIEVEQPTRSRPGCDEPSTSSAPDGGYIDDDIPGGHEGVDTNCSMSLRAFERAEEFAKRIWAAGWMVVHHKHLPKWLKDNDFLVKGHRPPMNSFWKCFKSIFRVHTETGNIWTHLLGCIAFIAVALYFVSRPEDEIQWQEKAIFSAFFLGAIICLGFSWTFHTVYCHSERVGRFFNKLDYCGIAMLTMGSFVPWLYYSFYCRRAPKITYLVAIFILGTTCIVVSMWDKFAAPKFRPVRAGVFIGLGLSGVIPAMHVVITDGFWSAINDSALGWLVLMAILYIVGAVIYAARIPERIWPGRFDIWCQSHQIFHMFVLAAAFVHYHGISQIAANRLAHGDCIEDY